MGSQTSQMKIWSPAIVEITNDSRGDREPWSLEGTEKVIYPLSYSKRLTPGVSMFDLYSGNAEWVYNTYDDPSLGVENFPNGSVWINGSSHKIYYYGHWVNWGRAYFLRSVLNNGRFPGIPKIGTTGSFESTNPSAEDASVKGYVLPCFSL